MATSEQELKRTRRQQTEDFLENHVKTPLLAQVENGIIQFQESARHCEEAQKLISSVHSELQKPLSQFDYEAAQTALMSAQQSLHKAIHAAPWHWQLRMLGGIYLIWYSAFLIACVALFYLVDDDTDLEMLGIPAWSMLFGTIGGSLRGIWWLRRHTARYTLRRSWAVYLYAPPIAGAALGIVSYVIYETGGLTLEFEPDDSSAVAMIFAFVGGYSWEWVNQAWTRITGTET